MIKYSKKDFEFMFSRNVTPVCHVKSWYMHLLVGASLQLYVFVSIEVSSCLLGRVLKEMYCQQVETLLNDSVISRKFPPSNDKNKADGLNVLT